MSPPRPLKTTTRTTLIVAASASLSLALSLSSIDLYAGPPAAAPPAAAPTSSPPSSPSAPNTTGAAQDAPAAQNLEAQAAERKAFGDQSMEALRYADALAAYSDAYAITKNPALLYNMGRALQALNRFPEALDKLVAFDAAASAELKARVPRLPALIADLQQRVSTLAVRTNIAGARILVRSTVVGRSPLSEPLKLVAGPAEIEVEADGYFTAKKTVDLKGGGTETVSLELFSKVATGVLSIRASAAPAEVFVDGARIGVAPLELNVAKGTHKIVVRHPDYRDYETSTVVPAGGSKQVTAALESKSIATRWWFWAGVGGVVAAGVVTAIAATTERSPDAGTIAPGQLSTDSRSTGSGGAPLFHF